MTLDVLRELTAAFPSFIETTSVYVLRSGASQPAAAGKQFVSPNGSYQ